MFTAYVTCALRSDLFTVATQKRAWPGPARYVKTSPPNAVHFAFVRVTSRWLVGSSIDHGWFRHCRDPVRVHARRFRLLGFAHFRYLGFVLVVVSNSAILDPLVGSGTIGIQ